MSIGWLKSDLGLLHKDLTPMVMQSAARLNKTTPLQKKPTLVFVPIFTHPVGALCQELGIEWKSDLEPPPLCSYLACEVKKGMHQEESRKVSQVAGKRWKRMEVLTTSSSFPFHPRWLLPCRNASFGSLLLSLNSRRHSSPAAAPRHLAALSSCQGSEMRTGPCRGGLHE